MPSLVTEVTQGNTKSQTAGSAESSGSGNAARVFRVILNSPGETFDPPATCGVPLGSAHPSDGSYYCTDYSIAHEGESRLVVSVTFNYSFTGSKRNDGQPPDERPANWSLSSSLMERPCTVWRRMEVMGPPFDSWGPWRLPMNTAGDIYDGITTLDPVVTITVTQYCVTDPTVSAMYVGNINSEKITLGSLNMEPHTVMLRSVQSVPTVEKFGDVTYRGWTATWEFAYRQNVTRIHLPGNDLNPDKGNSGAEAAIGWDMAVPVTGINVLAQDNPAIWVDNDLRNNSYVDIYGQPLRHGDQTQTQFYGRILEPLDLPDGVVNGSRQRAMVRVFSYEGGGSSQTPSALPVPLNATGQARNTEPFADGSRYYPIVWRYQVHPEMNFTQTLGLRLY